MAKFNTLHFENVVLQQAQIFLSADIVLYMPN